MKSRVKKILLPLFIVAAALASTAFMMAHRVTPDRLEVGEQIVPVEVSEIVHTTQEVVVPAQGTVTAARQVSVRPEVAGRIVELSPSLVPGGVFAAGETLAKIDPRDYQAQVAARREAVSQARLALRQEQARQAVAEEEWELLGDSVPPEAPNRDLALRLPQIERAEVALAAAEAALAKAELDLARCTVTAPFNALVLREQADVGQLVSAQTEVATLVGTDTYWVQVSLPVEHLGWIRIPGRDGRDGSAATVLHRDGTTEVSWPGRVERLLADVEAAGRMARLLIAVGDPLNLAGRHEDAELPLLLGSYVTVEIQGRKVDNVIVIPRRALREVYVDGANGAREGLWLMDGNDRLAIRAAEVVWRTEETVFLSNGFADGERLVTSTVATPIEGMKLVVSPLVPPKGTLVLSPTRKES